MVPSIHSGVTRWVYPTPGRFGERGPSKIEISKPNKESKGHSPLPESLLGAPATALEPLGRSAPTACLIGFCADPAVIPPASATPLGRVVP